MRTGAGRLVVGTLVGACLLVGCNYFRAAQPEAPTAAPFTPSYLTPDATLQTIADAIADKARTIGLTAYLGAFADSTSPSTPAYHQFFWPAEATAWEAASHTVPNWTIREEKNFYIKFATLQDAPYEVEWVPDENLPDTPGPTSDIIYLHRHYLVRTLDNAGNAASIQAIGFADLVMVRFPDESWRIARWDDRVDPAANPDDPDQMTLGRRRLNTTQ